MSEPSLPAFENQPPRARRTRTRKATPRSDASTLAAPNEITGTANEFALLADPETIAGKRPASKPRKAKQPRPAKAEPQPQAPSRASDVAPHAEPPSDASTEKSAKANPPPSWNVSEALTTLRQKWGHDESAAPPVALESTPGAVNPKPSGQLLDAAAARELAAEARKREQASREALEQARRELAHPVARHSAEAPQTKTQTPPASVGWKRRPLKSAADTHDVHTTDNETDNGGPSERSATAASKAAGYVDTIRAANRRSSSMQTYEASDTDSPDRLHAAFEAAQREVRELNGTLEIARDTASQQKRDLAELRGRLATSEQANTELIAKLAELRSLTKAAETERELALRRDLDTAHHEIDRLREQVRVQARDEEARDEERIRLKQALEEREVALAARNAQLEDLRERFEAQDQALEDARREYERERARHSENLERLAEVRATLAGIATQAGRAPATESRRNDPEAHMQERPEVAAPRATATPDAASPELAPAASHDVRSTSHSASDAAPPSSAAPAITPPTSPQTRPQTTEAEPANALPAIFDAWQDDHIRREFGPMGIDSFHDLLAAPLGRRAAKRQEEQSIVLIGRGAWRASVRLVEALVSRGTGPFRIHVADPFGVDFIGADRLPEDSPLLDLLDTFDFPVSPGDFDEVLEAIAPSVVVCRDFLSQLSQVDPWLACLERVIERRGSLVLSESTGVDVKEPPEEMTSIGERIWELMPERYTRVGDSDSRIESWREAFAASESRLPNQLVAQLRERFRPEFRPEMFTQFGFLAEPFLTSAIGANFDPEAPRDRRFLRQVADLDERKIEAGLAPALHLACLIDPLYEES